MYGTTGVSSMLISDQHQAAVPDGLVCYLLTPANATAQDQSCLFTSRQGQALRYFCEYLCFDAPRQQLAEPQNVLGWKGPQRPLSSNLFALCRNQSISTLGQNTLWPVMLGQAPPPAATTERPWGTRAQAASLLRAPRMTKRGRGKV